MSDTDAGNRSDEVRSFTLIGVAAVCVALNVGLGAVVYLVKLPVYLDACGTLVCALLAGRLGWRGFALAALVGAASFGITGLTINPVVLWFVPTQIGIAAFASWVIRPALSRWLDGAPLSASAYARLALLGIALGVFSGIISAPTITYVFGGMTGAGASVVVAVLLKSGATLYKSVLASGLASEPLDKTLQLVVAFTLTRATPTRVRAMFSRR